MERSRKEDEERGRCGGTSNRKPDRLPRASREDLERLEREARVPKKRAYPTINIPEDAN